MAFVIFAPQRLDQLNTSTTIVLIVVRVCSCTANDADKFIGTDSAGWVS